MTSPRRVVRATLEFFDDLDRALPPERGPDGEPSTADFQAFELLEIVELFATRFDDLPEAMPGYPECRLLVAAGRLVHAFAVTAQLAADGAVELLTLDIDVYGE